MNENEGMMTAEELNDIIREINLCEVDLPYCKGCVYINDVVRLLKNYWIKQKLTVVKKLGE